MDQPEDATLAQATSVRRRVLTITMGVTLAWGLLIVPLGSLDLVPMGEPQSINNLIMLAITIVVFPVHLKWPQFDRTVGAIYFGGVFYVVTSAQFLTPEDSLRPLLFFPCVGAVFLIVGSGAGWTSVVFSLGGFGAAVATGALKVNPLSISTFMMAIGITGLLFHLFRRQAIVALETIAARNAALGKTAREDPLTGLLNLRAFREAMTAQEASRQPFAIAFLDIDHFKAINDRYGHHGGDALLVSVAERLARTKRPQDVLARIGGEEFALLMPCSDQSVAEHLGERLRASIETAGMRLKGDALTLTISVGIAMSDPGDSADSAMQVADGAMYLAKRRGRNRVVTAGTGDTAVGRPPS